MSFKPCFKWLLPKIRCLNAIARAEAAWVVLNLVLNGYSLKFKAAWGQLEPTSIP